MQGTQPTTEQPKNKPAGSPGGNKDGAKSAGAKAGSANKAPSTASGAPGTASKAPGTTNKAPGAVAVTPAPDRTSFWKRIRRNRALVDPTREDAVLVKLDAVEEKLGAFEKRLASVENRVVQSIPDYTKAVDQRLQALESSVGGWIGSLEEKLSASEGSAAKRLKGLEGQLSRIMDIEDKLGGIDEVRDLSKKLRSGQQELDERTRSQGLGMIWLTVIALIAAAGTVVLLLEEIGILDF